MIYAIVLIFLALWAPPQTANQPTTCSAELTALFTPRRPQLGHYEVCVAEDNFREPGFHYSEAERLEPLDAFGTGGTYDRGRLTQLYRGRRVTVVRGWRSDDGRFESVMLLSPYPDAALRSLTSGTMIIRWVTDRR